VWLSRTRVAIVHRVGGAERLEFPMGQTLVETSGYISRIRFSSDGKRVVFVGSQGAAPCARYIQNIGDGKREAFTPPGINSPSVFLPLSPDGSRVWLNAPDGTTALYRTDLRTAVRSCTATPDCCRAYTSWKESSRKATWLKGRNSPRSSVWDATLPVTIL